MAEQRLDYDELIRDLNKRVGRLERAARATSLFLPNGPVPPQPTAGGIFYVEDGDLHYLGPGGTDTMVASS